MTLTTPAIASEPYSAEAPSFSTSSRSTTLKGHGTDVDEAALPVIGER